MASNLRVDQILPSTSTNVAIGTATTYAAGGSGGTPGSPGASGSANTGNGGTGGGGVPNGPNPGGSGIVIIAYPTS